VIGLAPVPSSTELDAPTLRRAVRGEAEASRALVEGGREERWRAFTEAGALLQDGVFVDARRHGPFAEYHPNGSKAAEGRYEVGQKVGEWRYWSADGQPVSGD
jgi:antitoxin component YwqK of YwqJK toxin-antitoxin module